MSQQAKITVYLQALGGHYLGYHAYNYQNNSPDIISITMIYSLNTLTIPYPINSSTTDGTTSTNLFVDGVSSSFPILTVLPPLDPPPPPPAVNFLTPGTTNPAVGQKNFQLPSATELATLVVKVPTPVNNHIVLTQNVILDPNITEYKITMAVPGLLLLPVQNLSPGYMGVMVKMMCGCPITSPTQPNPSIWPATDFTVIANVLDTSGNTKPYPLSYPLTGNGNSPQPFCAQLPANAVMITYTAVQRSTGNYGVLPQQKP
jgi:hypothetical protein